MVKLLYFLTIRYVLKKRFGRGSYGEVWLGFHWNCHQDSNDSCWTGKYENISFEKCSNENRRKSAHSTAHNCSTGSDDDQFILKRIMVIFYIEFFTSLIFPLMQHFTSFCCYSNFKDTNKNLILEPINWSVYFIF